MDDDFLQEEWSEADEDRGEQDWPEDDDSTDVVDCPNCGAEIYEDASQCPVCREYIVADSLSWSGKPIWYLLLGLAGIVAVILVLSGLAAWW